MRRHNKTGIVERKNATIKAILSKLNDESSEASVDVIVKRSAFLSNLFSGSKILSSFELVRGYRPSVVGLPSNLVTQELLDVHKEQTAIRKLQRLLHSRAHHSHQPELFNTGNSVWIFYDTSKQNEAPEWIKATAVTAHPHYLEVRRSTRGPPMRVADEDVRFAPRGALATQLMSCTLEEELNKPIQTMDDVTNHNEEVVGSLPDAATATPESNNTTAAHRSLLAKTSSVDRPDGGEKDIGEYAIAYRDEDTPSVAGKSLKRDISAELEKIHEIVGSKQVTARQLSFAPPFILDDASKFGQTSNWVDAYEEVPESEVPRYANVITSHVVYKLKPNEDGTRKMKARIVPHGNHDNEKDVVRKDSSNASLCVVRLLLSLVTFLGFRIATADIKGAFLQSGPINRQIFVRPPRQWSGPRGVIWKLRKLPYGIADAGRQWQKAVESWMLDKAGVERVFGIPQLFIQRDGNGVVRLLIAKVTDDFLLGGSRENMQLFINKLKKRFEVGKIVIDEKIHFDGCEIEQDRTGNVTMSMQRYVERLNMIELSRTRRKQRMEPATEKELKQYRSLAATIMFLGNAVLPQAAYATSFLQQLLPKIRVEELVTANDFLKDVLSLKPQIVFRVPPRLSEIEEVLVSTFADASFNHSSRSGYGQTGLITGLRIKRRNGVDLFHAIDWSSSKQKRVSYSPYGAEVLACAEGDDRGFYLKAGLSHIFGETRIRNELTTDSMFLFDTITPLHESKDYRLRPTVQRMRNSFDSRELDFMRWIPGESNPADVLTKHNPNTWALLNQILATGILCTQVECGFAVDSAVWH